MDNLKHTGFISYKDEYVDTRTGEIISPDKLHYKLTKLNSVFDDYGPLRGAAIDQEFKHRNSIARTATLLKTRLNTTNAIHNVYQCCDPCGVLKESPTLSKRLNKDWRRTLRTLESKGWIKRVTVDPEYNTPTFVREDIATYWMINPEFTIVRDNWTIQRQAWLRNNYECATFTKFYPILFEYLSQEPEAA